jgi:hypothetical protein
LVDEKVTSIGLSCDKRYDLISTLYAYLTSAIDWVFVAVVRQKLGDVQQPKQAANLKNGINYCMSLSKPPAHEWHESR